MKRALPVDPVWRQHADDNAAKGYPWAVWSSGYGEPLGLDDSKRTEAEARSFADWLRSHRRGHSVVVIVTKEGTENHA